MGRLKDKLPDRDWKKLNEEFAGMIDTVDIIAAAIAIRDGFIENGLLDTFLQATDQAGMLPEGYDLTAEQWADTISLVISPLGMAYLLSSLVEAAQKQGLDLNDLALNVDVGDSPGAKHWAN